MEIGKFNQMKAYLLKPKRLFTKKQNTIGGGVIKGENLGTREGFNRPKKYTVNDNALVAEVGEYVATSLANILKEIKADPSKANNENVFRNLTTQLVDNPKQRLVVYDDDTVDFFTRGERRGMEGARKIADEFGISMEEASKISMMEPDEQVLEQILTNTIKDLGNDPEVGEYVSTSLANILKEIKADPSKANNENVFRNLTTQLVDNPKQRLVVYDDDTVDFFTRGERRGMEGARKIADEFGISMEEASKISMMEPDEQVLELTKMRRLKDKNRTLNAGGGLNYLMGL